tara:strand:+ start:274 stop:405 length:132 start_codon:yes stop_codon:yes gene_type:complete
VNLMNNILGIFVFSAGFILANVALGGLANTVQNTIGGLGKGGA